MNSKFLQWLTSILFAMILIPSCMLPSFTVVKDEDKLNDSLIAILGEDELQEAPFFLSRGSAEKEGDIFKKKVFIRHSRLEPGAGILTEDALKTLYIDAKSQAAGMTHFITCLKVFFGLDSGKLRLIYQPLLMKRTNVPGPDSIGIYTIANNLNLNYYICDENLKIRQTSLTEVQPFMYDYRNRIKLRNNSILGDINKRFNCTDDFNGDPEAAIFTFQELRYLMGKSKNKLITILNVAVEKVNAFQEEEWCNTHKKKCERRKKRHAKKCEQEKKWCDEHKTCCNSPTRDCCTEYERRCVDPRERCNEYGTKFIKHSLIASANYNTDKVSIMGLNGKTSKGVSFYGLKDGAYFENLTHVCKPACDNLSYKLADPSP